MIDLDKWNEVFSTLSKNKLRTFLTGFGVFWGILMLVIMLGSGSGLEKGVKKEMGGFATNSIYMWAQSTNMAYMGMPPNRYYSLENEDVDAIKSNIHEIEHLAPRCQLGGYEGGNNVNRGTRSGAFNVNGDYPEFAYVSPMDFAYGRYINHLDIEQRRKVAVIGQRAYELLFNPGEDPIGKHIEINGIFFKVIGMFKTKKSGERSERDTQTIFIPFTTFQKAFNWGNKIGWLAMTVYPEYDAELVESKIRDIVKTRHVIHPDDDEAVGAFNAKVEFGKMQGVFTGIRFLIWFVGFGTLMAGVVGVSNIMLVVVKERTKEIGIRKAIGARPSNIITQIMYEAIVLTSFAGYMGLLLGILVLEGVNGIIKSAGDSVKMFSNPEIDLNVALTALLILIVSGALAGIVPARRAASINPIIALRND